MAIEEGTVQYVCMDMSRDEYLANLNLLLKNKRRALCDMIDRLYMVVITVESGIPRHSSVERIHFNYSTAVPVSELLNLGR